MRRTILLLKCGTGNPAVVARFGDYESFFIRARGSDAARFTVVAPYKGEPLPDPTRHSAVIVTGSSSSVTEKRPWMVETGAYLLSAGQKKVPVLGVCFGHQLLCEALGAPVQKHPRGREFGTVSIEVTDEGRRDPLFAGVAAKAEVQSSHEDEASALPEGARLLATNGHSAVQAIAFGDYLRGVQFHPEWHKEAIRAMAEVRRLQPTAYRADEAPGGRSVLRNFEERYIVPRED
ncbi:MAG: glutamine amidotransferase-related protein [Deltaproteobacteria bacterium]